MSATALAGCGATPAKSRELPADQVALLKKYAIPVPGPDAIRLAEVLENADGETALGQSEADIKEAVARQLTTRSYADGRGSCEPSIPACAAVVDRLATEETQKRFRFATEQALMMRSIIFNEMLKPDEISAAIDFAKTEHGPAIIKALLVSRADQLSSVAMSGKMMQLLTDQGNESVQSYMAAEKNLFDRFYAETGDLPRAKPRGRPPPPPPPPAPSPPSR